MKLLVTTALVIAACTAAGSASAGYVSTTPITFTQNLNKAAEFNLGSSYSDNILIDFYLSYTGTLMNNSFAGLYFGTDYTNPSFGLKANCGTGLCSNDVYARTKGTDGSFAANSNLMNSAAKAAPYHIVAYMQKTGGSNVYNKIDVWLDPSTMNVSALLENTTRHASFSGASTLSEFSKIGFRTANLQGSGRSVTVDDVRIEEVPEPGSLALMGLAMAGMGVMRRRKQK